MATRTREAQQIPLTTRQQARDRKGSAFTTTSPNRRRDQDSQIDTTSFSKEIYPLYNNE